MSYSVISVHSIVEFVNLIWSEGVGYIYIRATKTVIRQAAFFVLLIKRKVRGLGLIKLL